MTPESASTVVTACIALGSNLGDRRGNLDRALAALRQHDRIEVTKVSSYHETDPVGGPPNQGKYLNAAAELQTDLPADDLLTLLLDIERQLGRVRGVKNAARTIDLDILLYGDAVIKTERLTVPHPRMDERLFVLAPLAEIAPEQVVPGYGATIQHLADHARVHEVIHSVNAEHDRLHAKRKAVYDALKENPHPRKRRHLEQMAKTLTRESAELDARVAVVKTMLDDLHRNGPCHSE